MWARSMRSIKSLYVVLITDSTSVNTLWMYSHIIHPQGVDSVRLRVTVRWIKAAMTVKLPYPKFALVLR